MGMAFSSSKKKKQITDLSLNKNLLAHPLSLYLLLAYFEDADDNDFKISSTKLNFWTFQKNQYQKLLVDQPKIHYRRLWICLMRQFGTFSIMVYDISVEKAAAFFPVRLVAPKF